MKTTKTTKKHSKALQRFFQKKRLEDEMTQIQCDLWDKIYRHQYVIKQLRAELYIAKADWKIMKSLLTVKQLKVFEKQVDSTYPNPKLLKEFLKKKRGVKP